MVCVRAYIFLDDSCWSFAISSCCHFQILHVACIFQVQSEFLKVYKNFNGNDMTNGASLTTVNGATIKQILF